MDLGRPKESSITWAQIPHAKGAIIRGKGHAWACQRTFCPELCKSGWTDWFSVWVVDSVGPNEAQVHCQVAPVFGATWWIWLNHPCAVVMWLYVKLLWPLVIITYALIMTDQLNHICNTCISFFAITYNELLKTDDTRLSVDSTDWFRRENMVRIKS